MPIRQIIFLAAFFFTLSNAQGKNTPSRVTPKTLDQGTVFFQISTKERADDIIFTISITSKRGNFIAERLIWGKPFPVISTSLTYYLTDKTKSGLPPGNSLQRDLKYTESKGVIKLSFKVTKKEIAKQPIVFKFTHLYMAAKNGASLLGSNDLYYAYLRDFIPAKRE